jgi:hypothetical protein
VGKEDFFAFFFDVLCLFFLRFIKINAAALYDKSKCIAVRDESLENVWFTLQVTTTAYRFFFTKKLVFPLHKFCWSIHAAAHCRKKNEHIFHRHTQKETSFLQ